MSTLRFTNAKIVKRQIEITGSDIQYCYGTSSTPSGSWVSTTLIPDSNHQYVWQRERAIYNTSPVTYGEWTVAKILSQWVKGDDALVLTFYCERQTYSTNKRLATDDSITLQPDVQGYTYDDIDWTVPTGCTVDETGVKPELKIPRIFSTVVTVTMTVKNGATVVGTETKQFSPVDDTEYEHDFGVWMSTTLPAYTDPPTNSSSVIDGDFFVAGDINGDNSDWTGTDTDGTTKTFKAGVPYERVSGVWSNAGMTATPENSERILRSLTAVLSSNAVNPYVGALYGWFKNLTAIDAVIKNLTARNLTVQDSNGNFSFRAHAYDSQGNRLQYPIIDITYNGNTLFSVNFASGTIGMWNANIDGKFSSKGFATSEESSDIFVSMASSELPQYYDAVNWCRSVGYLVESYKDSTGTLSMAQADQLRYYNASTIADYIYVGSTYYTKNVSGTFGGQTFTSVNYLYSGSRSAMPMHGTLISGVLWICDEDSFPRTFTDERPTTSPSSVTISGTTVSWSDNGIYIGYMLESSFLSSKISIYGIPAGSEMQIISGSVSINGSSINPSASNFVFMVITTSSLQIRTTDSSGHETAKYVFNVGNYYSSNSFSLVTAGLATSKDGITTRHIVPMAGPKYDIGLVTSPYGRVYADELHGAVYFG